MPYPTLVDRTGTFSISSSAECSTALRAFINAFVATVPTYKVKNHCHIKLQKNLGYIAKGYCTKNTKFSNKVFIYEIPEMKWCQQQTILLHCAGKNNSNNDKMIFINFNESKKEGKWIFLPLLHQLSVTMKMRFRTKQPAYEF